MVQNYIYVMRYGESDSKIGISVRPMERLKQLRGWGACEVVKQWKRPSGDARHIEAIAHRLLGAWRHGITGQRERFRVGPEAAAQAVRLAITIAKGERQEEARRRVVEADLAQGAAAARPLPAVQVPHRLVGYVHGMTAGEAAAECDLLVRMGVPMASVHVDVGPPRLGRRRAIAACGRGDVLVVLEPDRLDEAARVGLIEVGAGIHAVFEV